MEKNLSSREGIKIRVGLAAPMIPLYALTKLKLFVAFRTFHYLLLIRVHARGLENALLSLLVATATKFMGRFSACHRWIQGIGDRSPSKILHLIAFAFCIPVFKCSHFFFKIAYMLNQRKLRLLCGENFPLEVYNGSIPRNGLMDVLQSLRQIKRGFDSTKAGNGFRYDHLRFSDMDERHT